MVGGRGGGILNTASTIEVMLKYNSNQLKGFIIVIS